MKNFSLFLSLFLATLANHSAITIPLAFVFLLISLFFNKGKCYFSSQKLIILITSITFIIIHSILFKLSMLNYIPAKEFIDSFEINFYKYILLASYVFIISIIIQHEKNELLIKILSFILIIHITFFIIQFFVVYLTGYYLDFIYPITHEHSRYLFYGVENNISIYRCTGLFVEPSTYSISIFTLLLILESLGNKNKFLFYLTLLTMILSLSSISFILIPFYYLLKIIRKIKLSYLIVTILLLFSFSYFSQNNFIKTQIDKINNTSSIRFNLVNAIFDRKIDLLITGSGLYGIEKNIIDGTKATCNDNETCSNESINRKYATPNDYGLLFYIFIKLGFFSFIILYLICYPFITNYKKMSFFICVLITKLQFAFPLFWIFVLILRRQDSNENTYRS
uniref:Wzy n=1 Tax=Proteus mirabilis TaxID=584 RepID=A0A385JMT8_PROMI|nr:wzy [Proteus mirabilis]